MHDLVIRGGTVVDGTGGEPFVADVAIDGDRVSLVGTVAAQGREEIDATGKFVTPGRLIASPSRMIFNIFHPPAVLQSQLWVSLSALPASVAPLMFVCREHGRLRGRDVLAA